jgi:hypothetical protein
MVEDVSPKEPVFLDDVAEEDRVLRSLAFDETREILD